MVTLSRDNLEAVEHEYGIYLKSKQFSKQYIEILMGEFGAFVLARGIDTPGGRGCVVRFPGDGDRE